jgi:hypothetical protein
MQVLSTCEIDFLVTYPFLGGGDVLAGSSPAGHPKNFSFCPQPILFRVSFPAGAFHVQLVGAPSDGLLDRD